MKIGFLPLLALIFITLKLTHVINWSWWLILLPLYGGWVIATPFLICAVIAKYRK